ncbi:cytochrome P450 [Lentinus tigrinus ALCF2SS1-7]|uniref:Cytochrome P450 n=1 Tax=Lentinus tigrinus ALCF2SS1-6 TaxID=1328759 RepID=A0A5C2SI08_9APHY|nr:cytochrome P450 [Lentinus tigrinus ALCF2SS1-6]RPD75099.1 cytochrome P450 [Lentinus tigrinus ALCF2SS1-7]
MVSILLALALAFVAYFAFFAKGRARGRPFPGPRPIPILGNALQMPRTKVWEKLYEWGQIYGRIYSISLFGTPLLILNTAEAGRELLDKKSALYSNRPLPKIIEMAGFDKGVVLEHDPPRLRHARKLLHMVLQPRQLPEYRNEMVHHVNVMLQNFLQDPDNFVQHIRHVTAGVAMEISHGHRVTSRADPYVRKANEFADNFAEASLPNNHVVDWLPFLAELPGWLPGMGFKEKARQWREQYFSLAEEGHQMVKDEIAKGIARQSLTYKALAESKAGEHPDDIIMFTATQVYTGGADTTVSTLSSFVLFMVKHPEVQKKAQEEILRVIGSDRLPTFDDRDSLPYVESILIETLRLRPPVSAVTREAGQDDVHNGFLVEKGTILIVNFWGMLREEKYYPDPHTFKPERWLAQDRRQEWHPYNVTFGFGRRTCPGQHLAEELLFTSIARILALFDISPIRGADGNPIIPSDDSTNGGITFPVPFRCSIQPQSSRTNEILQGLVGQHE